MAFLIWSLLIAASSLAFGIPLLVAPARAGAALARFGECRRVAAVLTAVGWLWTARELDMIGIDVFDRFLKMFPGEVWILAIILIPLTIAWMPKLLALKGVAAVLMLYPASFFRVSRLVDSDWRVVAVGWTYAMLVLGMYTMFYTPRVQAAIEWIVARKAATVALGAVFTLGGVALAVAAVLAGR